MIGLFDAAKARVATCPSVQAAETGINAEAAFEMLALGMDVTAVVHPLSDTADPIREAGMQVSQRVVYRFGVTMALVYPGGIPQFETARTEIKAVLCGWIPEGASVPVAYAGGQLLDYQLGEDGGRMLWLLFFTVHARSSYGLQP